MKIGVLTFHHVYNYGAVLQSYATLKFLRDQGFDAEIIDVRPFSRERPEIAKYNKITRRFVKSLRLDRLIPIEEKSRKFDEFRSKDLNMSAHFRSVQDYISHGSGVDAIVVGSDQVWGSRFGVRALNEYFLKNVEDSVLKISYAACCGSASVSRDLLKNYQDAMLDFDALSVRDGFSRSAITDVCGRSPEIVVDPTLLIDWDHESQDRSKMSTMENNYFFYYGQSKNGDIAAARLESVFNVPVMKCAMETDARAKFGDGELGPWDWISSIRRSKFVVTKSFHGLMFALVFKKPVIVVPSSFRSSDRLLDACERFDLLPAFVAPDTEDFSAEAILESVNWEEVWKRMDFHVGKSKSFLSTALKSKSSLVQGL